MPRLMDKRDWMQTVADVGTAESVWIENVSSDADGVSFALSESGRYRVIFVKLENASKPREVSSRHLKRAISAKVRALRGAARIEGNQDYKDVLSDALVERYEALGFLSSLD